MSARVSVSFQSPWKLSVLRERLHHVVAHSTPLLVGTIVKYGFDPQTSRCRRGAGHRDDHFKRPERCAAPVLRDVAEHAVLDLVPLARAGRKVRDAAR